MVDTRVKQGKLLEKDIEYVFKAAGFNVEIQKKIGNFIADIYAYKDDYIVIAEGKMAVQNNALSTSEIQKIYSRYNNKQQSFKNVIIMTNKDMNKATMKKYNEMFGVIIITNDRFEELREHILTSDSDKSQKFDYLVKELGLKSESQESSKSFIKAEMKESGKKLIKNIDSGLSKKKIKIKGMTFSVKSLILIIGIPLLILGVISIFLPYLWTQIANGVIAILSLILGFVIVFFMWKYILKIFIGK